MSSPTGAGYGFVGSVFGETDIVSPYLAMLPKQEQQKPQTFKTGDAFAVTTNEQYKNNYLQSQLDSYNQAEYNSPEAINLMKSNEVLPEQAGLVTGLSRNKKNHEAALTRLADVFNQSNNVFNQYSLKANEYSSDFNNIPNQRKLESYQRASSLLSSLSEIDGSSKQNIHREGRFYTVLTPQASEQVAEMYKDILPSLIYNRSVILDEDGTMIVDATGKDFTLNEADFVSSKNWRAISENVAIPFSDISSGREVGNVYFTRGNRSMIADQYGTLIKNNFFSPSASDNIGIRKDGTATFNPNAEYQLSQPSIYLAQELGVDVNESGYVSAEDAQRIYEKAFEHGSAQAGYSRSSTERASSTGGSGATDELNPVPKMQRLDGKDIPFASIEAGDAANFPEGLSSNAKKIEKPVGVSSAISISPKRDAVIEIPQTKGKMRVSDIAISEDGRVYFKGAIATEGRGAFDVQSDIRTYQDKGLMGSDSDGVTRFIEMDTKIASNMVSGLEIPREPNQSPLEAIKAYVREIDAPYRQEYSRRIEELKSVISGD